MARGAVDGLASAHPLGELLPGVYLEDSLALVQKEFPYNSPVI